MVFPKKRQARAWCLSSVYRHLIRFDDFKRLDSLESDTDKLAMIFNDDTIFINKGDAIYFKNIYNSVANNFNALGSIVQTLFGDSRARSSILESALLCALAEILYMEIPSSLVVAEYSILLNIYGEDGANGLLDKLLEINSTRIPLQRA